MAFPRYNLNVWLDRQTCIEGPLNARPRNATPLVIGSAPLVKLRAFTGDSAPLTEVDLSACDVTLAVDGNIPLRSQIVFSLTGLESPPFDTDDGAYGLAKALQRLLGADVSVSGDKGFYQVKAGISGNLGELTGAVLANSNADLGIAIATAGTAQSYAEWRITLLPSSPAQILPNEWTNGEATLDMTSPRWRDSQTNSAAFFLEISNDSNSFAAVVPVAIRAASGTASDAGLIELEEQGEGYLLLE